MSVTAVGAISASTAAKSGATSLPIPLPSAAAAGDVAVVLIGSTGNATNPPVAPTGWTVTMPAVTVGTALGTWIIASKQLVTADLGTSPAATCATGSRLVAVGQVLRGHDGTLTATTPVTITGTSAGGAATVTAPDTTPAEAGDVVLALAGAHAAGGTPFTSGVSLSTSGWVDDGGTTTTYGTAANMGGGAAHRTTTGTATVTGPTFTGSQNENWLAVTVLLRPVPAPIVTGTLPRRLPGTDEWALYLDRTHSIALTPRSVVIPAVGGGGREVPPHWYYYYPGGGITPPVADTAWHISGLTGAGFQNVIAQGATTLPSGARLMLSGADVAGVLRSSDRKTWVPRNVGMTSLHISALATHPTDAARAWALADTGLHRTTDGADTWVKMGLTADGRGNGDTLSGVGTREHPRDTGRLIALDADGSHLWVAGWSTGVRMSADGGASQTGGTLFTADHVHAIIPDPNVPGTLYVAVHNYGDPAATNARSGVWKITDATSTMAAAVKVGDWAGTVSSTIGCIELTVDNYAGVTTLVAVADTAGVFYLPNPAAATTTTAWTAWNTSLPTGSTLGWETLDLRRDATGALECAVGAAGITGTPARSADYIYTSSSFGGAWTPVTDSAHAAVSYLNLGDDLPAYIGQQPYLSLGHGNDWVSSQLLYDHDDPGTLFTAGRGGVWRLRRTPTLPKPWEARPATSGMAVTVNMWVAGSPVPTGSTAAAVAGRIIVGSMDYGANRTADGGVTFSPTGLRAAADPTTTSDTGCFDSSPKAGEPVALVAGCSLRGPSTISPANGVYLCADVFAPTPSWVSLPFPAGTPARPTALAGPATSTPASNTFTRTAHGLTAGAALAVTSSPTGFGLAGVYYVTAPTTNTFQLAATAGGTAITFTGSQNLVTATGSPDPGAVWLGRTGPGGERVILALTNGAGVLRKQGSADWTYITDLGTPRGNPSVGYFEGVPQTSVVYGHLGGAVWRSDDAGLNWTKILAGIGNGYARLNTLAVDPRNPAVLYVSAGSSGVLRVDNAATSTGTSTTLTTTLTGQAVGWIALDPTTAALYALGTSPVALLRWGNPAADATSVDVSDRLFRDNCGTTRSAGFSADGVLLACDNGQGAYWSKPGGAGPVDVGTGSLPVGVPNRVVWGGIDATTTAGLAWTAWNTLEGVTTGAARIYAQALDGTNGSGGDVIANRVRPALEAGAFVVYSFIAGNAATFDFSWAEIPDPASPKRAAIDAQLDTHIAKVKGFTPAQLRRLILCFHHEPDNDGVGQGTKEVIGTGAAAKAYRAAYRRAFRYIRNRFRAAGILSPWCIILISDTFTADPTKKVWWWFSPDVDDDEATLLPPGQRVLDSVGWDPYKPVLSGGLTTSMALPTFDVVQHQIADAQAAAVAGGTAAAVLPVVIGELGLAESGYKSPKTSFTFPTMTNAGTYTVADFQREMVRGAVAAGWRVVCTWASGDYFQDSSSLRTTSQRAIFAAPATYPDLWAVGQAVDGASTTGGGTDPGGGGLTILDDGAGHLSSADLTTDAAGIISSTLVTETAGVITYTGTPGGGGGPGGGLTITANPDGTLSSTGVTANPDGTLSSALVTANPDGTLTG